MNEVKRTINCSNCAYEMDQPTVIVDGESFCCSGCVQGGPCICSYTDSPTVPDDNSMGDAAYDVSAPAYDPDCPYSSAFVRMVDNVLKEVEITQQAVKGQEGPVKDLLELLQRTARLLQIMTYRVEDQRQAQTPDWVSRIQSDLDARESEEQVKLFVQGLSDPDLVFSYTRALSKLPSVNGLKLVNVNDSDACYLIQTRSKAKFARDVMSLPDFQPLRVHSTTDDITVRLSEDTAVDDPLDAFSKPVHTTPAKDHPEPPAKTQPGNLPSRSNSHSGGFLEVGIDGFFNARHFLIKDGEPGPIEMKSWRVEISLEGSQVAENGQLAGLDTAQSTIESLLVGYNNKLLNNIPPYDQTQPTPENIARTLYDQISSAISHEPLRVKGLKVWVNPTQYVWYSEPSDNAI